MDVIPLEKSRPHERYREVYLTRVGNSITAKMQASVLPGHYYSKSLSLKLDSMFDEPNTWVLDLEYLSFDYGKLWLEWHFTKKRQNDERDALPPNSSGDT